LLFTGLKKADFYSNFLANNLQEVLGLIYVPNKTEGASYEHKLVVKANRPGIYTTDRLLKSVKTSMADLGEDDCILMHGNLVVVVLCCLIQSNRFGGLKLAIGNERKVAKYLDIRMPEKTPEKNGNTIPVVYTIDDQGHDLKKAEKYGTIRKIFTSPMTSVNRNCNHCLSFCSKNVECEDMMLLAGQKYLNAIACSVAMIKNGHVKMIIFDAKRRDYFLRDITKEMIQ